jgi:hypothetical protein
MSAICSSASVWVEAGAAHASETKAAPGHKDALHAPRARTYWLISTTAMSSRVVKSLNASSMARAGVSAAHGPQTGRFHAQRPDTVLPVAAPELWCMARAPRAHSDQR